RGMAAIALGALLAGGIALGAVRLAQPNQAHHASLAALRQPLASGFGRISRALGKLPPSLVTASSGSGGTAISGNPGGRIAANPSSSARRLCPCITSRRIRPPGQAPRT